MALDPEKEKRILAECVRLGQPIPDRILNAPEIPDFMQFYFDAFFELTTDRQIGFGEGPIPSRSIRELCDRLDLDYDERRDFVYFIRLMDSSYLESRQPKKTKGK